MAPRRSRSKQSSELTVKVDASLKKRYEALIGELRAARTKGASAFDALWEAVGAIVEHHPPLYVVGGYKDDVAFFRKELDETTRNAYRFVRVAKFASPRDETKYGTTKLDAALSYIVAKLGAPLEHPPLPVAFDRLRIPVKKDGKVARLSLKNARVEDVAAATRALVKKTKEPTSSAERALRDALASHGALESVRVRVRGGVVSFTGVPVGALGAFTGVVKGVTWETPEERVEARRGGKRNRKTRTH